MSGARNNKVTQDISDEEFDLLLKEKFSSVKEKICLYPLTSPNSTDGQEQLLPLDDNNVYNFRFKHRGLAVIVSNENFKTFKKREGSHEDAYLLKRSFDTLGFHSEVFEDLTGKRMITLAKSAAKLYPHGEADCFVFVILTHGEEDGANSDNGKVIMRDMLIGSDEKPVNARQLIDCFRNANCEGLKGKPRLFFIGACRGKKLMEGVEPNSATVDTNALTSRIAESSLGDSDDQAICCKIRIPVLYPDCLVMFSTPPGYKSWNSAKGFIGTLCGFLDPKNVENTSFLRVLTQVIGKVALQFEFNTPEMPEQHKKKSMAIINTMLTKDIFMRRKMMTVSTKSNQQ